MPLTQADREEIAVITAGAVSTALASLGQFGLRPCRPDYPHDGKLRYSRGNPGVYTCECGQRYMKNGRGGLMLAEPVSDLPALGGGR